MDDDYDVLGEPEVDPGWSGSDVAVGILMIGLTILFALLASAGSVSGAAAGAFGLAPSEKAKPTAIRFLDSSQVERRTIWLESRDTMTIDYQTSFEAGSLAIEIDGPTGWLDKMTSSKPKGPARSPALRVELTESGADRIEFPVGESGFYDVYFIADGLTGSIEYTLRTQ